MDGLSGNGWTTLNGDLGGNRDTTWTLAAIGDFNGDGTADILWRDGTYHYTEWLMNGAGISSTLQLGAVPSYWTVADSGDFNGDGKTDILWKHTNGTIEMDDIGTSGWTTLNANVGNLDSSWAVVAAGH
jgi:hypothetical protein